MTRYWPCCHTTVRGIGRAPPPAEPSLKARAVDKGLCTPFADILPGLGPDGVSVRGRGRAGLNVIKDCLGRVTQESLSWEPVGLLADLRLQYRPEGTSWRQVPRDRESQRQGLRQPGVRPRKKRGHHRYEKRSHARGTLNRHVARRQQLLVERTNRPGDAAEHCEPLIAGCLDVRAQGGVGLDGEAQVALDNRIGGERVGELDRGSSVRVGPLPALD